MRNVLFLLLLCSQCTLFATNYYWIGGNGDWEVATNWSPNGVPGLGDAAIINSGSVSLSRDASVSRLSVASAGTLTIQPSGELTVRVVQSHVSVAGTLDNQGVLMIDKASGSGGNGYILQVEGSLYNEGSMSVTSTNTGLVRTNAGSIFTNDGTLELRTAFAGYAMISYGGTKNNGTFLIENLGDGVINYGNLENRGIIEIECEEQGLYSNGQFDNYAVINIHILGNSAGALAIQNIMDFVNHKGGEISLRGGLRGLRNSGSFTNRGELSVDDSDDSGIINLLGGDFTNTTTGQIYLTGFGFAGINNYSQQALFKNQGDITITNAPNAYAGLRNISTFRNLTHGTLTISASCVFGVENVSGTVLNKGDLYVSGIQGGGVHGNAIRNADNATFRNWNGGFLEVQSTTNKSVFNEAGSTFDNSDARLLCAEAADFSIHNEGFFHNRRCGEVRCPEKILNASSAELVNDAFVYTSFGGQHENEPGGIITNNGVIEDLHDAFDGVSMTNNGVIAAPIAGPVYVGQPVSNALGLGSLTNATVIGWWVDEQGNIPAGTYDAANNIFTPNNNAGKNTKLYVEIDLDVDKNCKAVMVEVRFLQGIRFGQSNIIKNTPPTTAPASRLQVYPNPCPGDCQARIQAAEPGEGILSLHHANGQLIRQQRVYAGSSETIPIEAGQLAPGVYWLRWSTATGAPLTTPMVITR